MGNQPGCYTGTHPNQDHSVGKSVLSETEAVWAKIAMFLFLALSVWWHS